MDEREQPVAAAVQDLEAASPRSRRRRLLPRLCAITAALCLVAAVALVATADENSDDGRAIHAMGPDGTEGNPALDHIPATTTTDEATTTTARTAPVEEIAELGPPTTAPRTGSPPVPLRQTAPSTLDPYEWLTVESVDPCPPGTDLVEVLVWGVGGTMGGEALARAQLLVDGDGHWSTTGVEGGFGIHAVGGIDNVSAAMTSPELDVRTSCEDGRLWDERNTVVADYLPLRIDHGHAPTPELTATWDGQTITMAFSGCPTTGMGGLHVGDAPLGPTWFMDLLEGVHDDAATPGSAPGSWTHAIELPEYDSAEGLWAYGFCSANQWGLSPIWRSLPVELDPPG